MDQLYTDGVHTTMTTTVSTRRIEGNTFEATNGRFTAVSDRGEEDAIEKLSTQIQTAVKEGVYYPGM